METPVKLPASSYEELKKIIQAYGKKEINESASLEELQAICGANKHSISRNNGFLIFVELIDKKQNGYGPTIKCKELARSYEYYESSVEAVNKVKNIWKEIMLNNKFYSTMLSAIKIRKGMDETSFRSHIVYSSGLDNTVHNRVGTKTIIDIYKEAGILKEENNKLTVLESEELDKSKGSSETISIANQEESDSQKTSKVINSKQSDFLINININITIEEGNIKESTDRIKQLINDIKNSL